MQAQGLAARRAALAAIRAVDEDGAWSTLAVPDAVDALADARDRALASRLAYDTIRWQGTLDWALGFASSRPLDDVEPALLRVLRMGTLQLLRLRIPDRAVVDTAATLAREAVPKRRADGAAGFVNGVLRGLARRVAEDGEGLPWPDPSTVEGLVLHTAHPEWVVRDAVSRFGEDARAVLEADNEAPGLTLRANVPVRDLIEELRGEGLDVFPHDFVDRAVSVPGADPRRLACVAEGRAVPQDAASMVVAEELAPKPGDRVLDLCAGPGGKATYLATMLGEGGSVTAVEQHPHRARLVEEAAARQGVDVAVVVGDAIDPKVVEGRFDAVLVDAPCTGLGVGRRRPEVRWRRTPRDATDLQDVQAAILVQATKRVAPGGRLTFAVCTWTTAETLGVLEREDVRAAVARFEESSIRQLRPDVDDTDGMFIATWDRARD